MHIITCEQVSSGHPDKICDQIADAVVTDVLRYDPQARVAIEVLIKGNQIIIAGELTSSYSPDYRKLAGDVFRRIGLDRLGYEEAVFDIHVLVDRQSPDIALGVDKDPTKVDRSGAYIARKIARDIVMAGYADKAEVQIAYAIGVAEPVSVYVDCFGTEKQNHEFLEGYIRDNYDLTPKGIIDGLGLRDVDYNKVSSHGHFGKAGLPWEE